MKNKYGGECQVCQAYVKPGEGECWQWFNDDEDRNIWLVKHSDPKVCERNQAVRKAEEDEALTRRRAKAADRKAVVEEATATGLDERDDWSWDDYSFSLGGEICRGEFFKAVEYKDDGQVIGFVVKEI